MLSDDYLVKGITGLSRALENNWVAGHYGAAVIATYYFCRDNELDTATEKAIKNQLDELLTKHGQLFESVPAERSEPHLLAEIPRALDVNIDRLSRQGHNVIYATLAIKALQQAPEMITPRVTHGICSLIQAFNGKATDPGDVSIEGDDTIPEYTSHDVIADFTFSELLKVKKVYLKSVRGDAGHLVTHAHSLIELSMLGYSELAQKGYNAHRLQAKLLRKLHAFDSSEAVTLPEPINADPLTHFYWEGDLERKDWLTGHAFKYCYHFYDLLKCVSNPFMKESVVRQLQFILMHIDTKV